MIRLYNATKTQSSTSEKVGVGTGPKEKQEPKLIFKGTATSRGNPRQYAAGAYCMFFFNMKYLFFYVD